MEIRAISGNVSLCQSMSVYVSFNSTLTQHRMTPLGRPKSLKTETVWRFRGSNQGEFE